MRFDEILECVRCRLGDVALNRDLPRRRLEPAREPLRPLACARVELVEVVEAGDVFVRVRRVGGAERAFTNALEFPRRALRVPEVRMRDRGSDEPGG